MEPWSRKAVRHVHAAYVNLSIKSATRFVWWKAREKLAERLTLLRFPNPPPVATICLRREGKGRPLSFPLTAVSLRTLYQICSCIYDVPAEVPVETIVYLGANIGFASRWLLRKFRGARLVAVEPDPFNVTVLRRNLANVPGSTVVEACIAARDQEVYLQLGTQADNHVMVHHPSERSLAVPGISMLSLMRRCGLERIDLLKVDIEGAEAELLGGTAEQWIDRVRCAVIELHDELPVDELKRRLAPHGFVVTPSRDFAANRVAVCLNKGR